MAERRYSALELGVIGCITPFVALFVVLFMLPWTFEAAFVEMKLWNWFPAVYFHLQPASFWMMLGVSFFISSFKASNLSIKDQKVDWKYSLISCTLAPLVVLLFGYVIHLQIK